MIKRAARISIELKKHDLKASGVVIEEEACCPTTKEGKERKGDEAPGF